MPTLDVICLANSWKHGGRCVAGLRMDGGGWVRPVSREPEGVLLPWHYTLAAGGEAALGDVLRMRLTRPLPDPHHPENWRMDYGLWGLAARPLPPLGWEVLWAALAPGPDLLGDCEDRIAYAALQKRGIAASLALVRPEGLQWQIRKGASSGKRQTRAVFSFAGVWYNLPLTDPARLKALASCPVGCYPEERADALLTVSLGEPFAHDGFCYKLAAAVLTPPR